MTKTPWHSNAPRGPYRVKDAKTHLRGAPSAPTPSSVETETADRMKYRTIVADPPWRYNKTQTALRSAGRGAGAEHHYGTLTNGEVAELPVADMVGDDAHLYLWVTNPVLLRMDEKARRPDPVEIVRGWGFEPKALVTWCKEGPPGPGWWFRGATEHALFAVRGDLPIDPSERERNIVSAPKGGHSRKPDSFLDLVERVSPAPYLEMFARRARFGWDYWGDESLGTAELAG